MSARRLEKVNRHIQRVLAEIISREAVLPNNVLVTVGRVETAGNLQSTTVWLYIQPLERADEILDLLKSQLYELQGALNRALAMRPLPRIMLRIDYGSDYAQHIEKKLDEIKRPSSAA